MQRSIGTLVQRRPTVVFQPHIVRIVTNGTHVGLTSPGAGGGNMSIYFDGSFITSSSASDPSATLTSFSLGSLGASQYHDGRIDEFRSC